MKLLLLALLLFCPPALAATATDGTVGSYHGAPDRSGHYIVPGLTWQSAKDVRRDAAFDGRVEGHIYAQPLYWRPDTGRSLIITATESNIVFALDATTGAVVWRSGLGRQVSRQALACGNIDPVGVTGTPVIDQAQGAIYLDAMVDEHNQPRHRIFGLRLTDGGILPGFPVDVAAQLEAQGVHFDPSVQNQRGALALTGGRLMVPFGGHGGDCGSYHGVVVSIAVDRPAVAGVWQTRALKGGIWAPAGLSEADGALFFATGNTEGAHGWGDGEAVFRVGPDLRQSREPADVFVPANWKQLDEADLDLGGVTPLPLTLPMGAAPLLIAFGKDGNAYLLNRSHLGGQGGAIAILRAAGGPIITAPAVYPVSGGMMVAYEATRAACPNGGFVLGIGALTVTAESGHPLRSAWCARLSGRGAPIVTTTEGGGDPIVWEVGAEGDDRLHGYRGDNGQAIYPSAEPGQAMPGLRHFATILVAAGRFYVAGDGRIFVFSLPR